MQEQNPDPSAYPGQYASPAGMGGSPQYTGYSPSGNDPLNTAKWSGLVQIIIGSLVMAFGLCCMSTLALIWDTMMSEPEFQQAMAQMPDPELAKVGIIIVAGLFFVAGLVMVLLGVFIRRGSKVAAICSIVAMGLLLLYFVLYVGVLAAAAAGNAAVIPGLLFSLMMLGVCIGVLVLCVAGLRSINQWHREWAQWQDAYDAYQNQQQQP